MTLLSSLAFAVALSSPGLAVARAPLAGQEAAPDREDLRAFGRVIGLEFSDAELEQLLPDVLSRLPELEALRLDEEQLPNSVFPALVFDLTHPRYPHEGRDIAFRYRASGARTSGILQPRYVHRALHFELPGPTRRDPDLRDSVTAALARLLEELLAGS